MSFYQIWFDSINQDFEDSGIYLFSYKRFRKNNTYRYSKKIK